LVYLNTTDKYTIAVGLEFFKNIRSMGQQPLQPYLMAATTLSIIPCIGLFFAGQRYFVQGIVLSGIKG
jgi:multiple sugar transport system permease protein